VASGLSHAEFKCWPIIRIATPAFGVDLIELLLELKPSARHTLALSHVRLRG
jgi:hypothetical protein